MDEMKNFQDKIETQDGGVAVTPETLGNYPAILASIETVATEAAKLPAPKFTEERPKER